MSLWKRFTTENVGSTDRVIRALPFVAFILVLLTGSVSGGWLLVFGIVAGMSLFTALSSRCSIYAVLGFSTCPLKGK